MRLWEACRFHGMHPTVRKIKISCEMQSTNRPIVVIGSINMDLVCRVPAMPQPGETLLGTDLATFPGGKGANQAVAAARLGAPVCMVGRVGADDFGDRLLQGLGEHKVETQFVTRTDRITTGVAIIMVDADGENSIVVTPGANGQVTPADVDAAEPVIREAACVLLQLEIPLATVQHAITLCRRLGVYTILDPAPAPRDGLPEELFKVDLLTPNQTEAEMILGGLSMGRMKRSKRVDACQLAGDLLARGPGCVVLKLGERGAMLVDDQITEVEGFAVDVVDTTAAGDAFTAALAVAHREALPKADAMRFANAAGALACTTFGAQPSLPLREDVEKLLSA